MPNDLSQYLAVKDQIRPGDVIVFSGSQDVSPLIEFALASPASHTAVVRQGVHEDTPDVKIIESTIEGEKSGVQTNELGPRLANYDAGGRAWWLPLSDEARAAINWDEFYAFCGAADGFIGYDTAGLFEYLAREIPILGQRIFQKENDRDMFCSGFVVALFEHSKLLRGFNVSKVSPQDVCEMKIYRAAVQILGPAGSLLRFNSVG